MFENFKILEKFLEFKFNFTNFPFTSILLRPRNTLAAAGSCKTWFYLFRVLILKEELPKKP